MFGRWFPLFVAVVLCLGSMDVLCRPFAGPFTRIMVTGMNMIPAKVSKLQDRKQALSIEEKSGLKAALHPFLVECEEKFGMTEEQFEEEKNKGADANIDPCFMSCFLKKAEFFDSKGMYDVEKTTEFIKANIESEDALQIFGQISEECAKVNDEEVSDGEEGCDRAQLLFKCIVEVKKKNNLEN